MNITKLTFLINDLFESVERSKLGNIYLKDKDGNVIMTSEGCPYSNIAAVQILSTLIQSKLMQDAIRKDMNED